MTPEQQQQLLALVSGVDQDPLIQRQLAEAQALMQGDGKRYSSTLGALGGGLADVLNAYRGAKMQQEAQGKQQSALDAKAKARQAFLDAMNPQPTAAAPGAALGRMQQQGGGMGGGASFGGAPVYSGGQDAAGMMGRVAAPKPVDPRIQQLQAALFGAASGDPFMAKMGGFQLQQLEGQQARQSEMDKLGLRARLDREKEDRDRAWDREKFRQEMGLRRTSLERDKSKNDLSTAEGLRKEFHGNPAVKSAVEVMTSYDKVRRSAAMGSAAGDMSMIFGFMRLQDPGTGVKEGEYANASNAKGIPEYVIGLYNKAVDGQLLTPAQRADFLKAAGEMVQAQVAPAQKLSQRYSALAQKIGVDPSDVVFDLGFGRQEVRDKSGKLIGYINADGSEEEVE